MQITKVSQITGLVHTREIDVDPDRYAAWVAGGSVGFVQDLFPHLSADDREFMLTGITPEEWDEFMGEEEEDIDDDYTGYGDIPPNAGSAF